MKKIYGLFLVIALLQVCYGQTELPVQKDFVPLVTTKSYVEKSANFISEDLNGTIYETDYGRIVVKYSRKPCDDFGWNVPANTVISYDYFPAQTMLVNEAKRFEKNTIKVTPGDDVAISIFVNREEGREYVTRYDNPNVIKWTFFARSDQASKRCSNFFPFDPVLQKLEPYERLTIDDPTDWDPGEFSATILKAKRENLRAYILIYCDASKASECDEVDRRLHLLVKQEFPNGTSQVIIRVGEPREETQVEGFLLPQDLSVLGIP